ncbi:hypothetical protein [Tropicimonas sp.]|uniref:hypothetical protein n=1 Tax=Tropicimonas sp. TaxID=2067044 RepID=UPI003A89A924
MLKIAFLLLTLTEAGDPRLTVSYSETPEECEGLGFAILGILDEAGATVLHHRCGETALDLTPFEHGLGPEHEVNRFRVTVPVDADWSIEPLSAEAACQGAPDSNPAVYCAVSVQAVADDR